MKIAVAFCTGRQEPKLDWLIDGIENQAVPGDEITLIVVDAILAWPDKRACTVGHDNNYPHEIGWRPIDAITRVVAVPPKPNPWQGPHRIIDREGWGMANARNTALIVCPADVPYIVFVDDRSKLGPQWLDTVRAHAGRPRSVLAGAYDKLEDGPNGTTITTLDHRLGLRPQGMINCGGGWLYGCCIGIPVDWALAINGYEEGMDGLTLEDVVFGLNLTAAGYRIDYIPGAMVHQDRTRENHSTKGGVYFARDKGVSPNDKSHAALKRFGKRRRTEFTPDLAELRARYQAGELGALGSGWASGWPRPDPDMRDWFDGELIRESFTKI